MSDDTPVPPPAPAVPAVVKISREEHQRVVDHINRKAVSPDDACPVCGDPYNSVAAEVYHVDVMTQPPSYFTTCQPLYSTVCHNCGFVRFFNRVVVDKLIDRHLAGQEGPLDADDGN